MSNIPEEIKKDLDKQLAEKFKDSTVGPARIMELEANAKMFCAEYTHIKNKYTELLQEVQQLEQAGTRLSNRIIDVLDNIIDESALLDALDRWDKARKDYDE